MNQMISYLWAQARRQPLDTLRFAAGEAWRRGRMRWVDSLDGNLPQFPTGATGKNFAAFLPRTALEGKRLGDLPFAARTIAAGQRICRYEFEIFGESAALGPEIDWQRDWKTGYRWPLERPGGFDVLPSPAGAPAGTDIKRLWELARFHHALALGQAYALTRDAAYAREFAAQVSHWIRANPYPLGPHWAMPMEIAVRAINWTTAAAFFTADGALDDEFERMLLGSLFVHGRHLAVHREWNPVARANHYLACLAGLLHLGVAFVDAPEGRDWLVLARDEIFSEMARLVGDDGVAQEGSTGYHALVAELFLTSALLLIRVRGEPHHDRAEIRDAIRRVCGPTYAERLEKMFGFLAALRSGRARPPVWGDADDGRLLPFGGSGEGAVIPLAQVGGALYGQARQADSEAAAAEIFWRLGSIPERAPALPVVSTGQAFPAGGFFFFSSQRLRGSIRCGPLGARGWSNHAHGDQLSVEFCCEGRPVVVDPGLPSYGGDPKARNLFRSTRYHNVAVVAGAEQNRFWPTLLFRIVDDTLGRVVEWDPNPAGVVFCGEHFGYARLKTPTTVRRELHLDAKFDVLTLRDHLCVRGRAPVEWFFHLAPEILPEPHEETAATLPRKERDGLTLAWNSAWRVGPVALRVWSSLDARTLIARPEEGWVAPRFGKKVPARILSFRGEARGTVSTVFEFTALDEPAPAGKPARETEAPA